MKTQSLLASEPLKVSGSRSLVGEVTDAAGASGVGGGWTFWVARVWASKAMATAKSPPVSGLPPVSGSGANTVFMVPEGLSAIGGLARVKGIFESESVA